MRWALGGAVWRDVTARWRCITWRQGQRLDPDVKIVAVTIRTTKWPPSIFLDLGSTPRVRTMQLFLDRLPSNDLVFHGNGLEGGFYFLFIKKNFFTCARCRVTCRDMKVHTGIAGDFVPGRIRTQENSYPKWLGTNSLVNSYPGTNYPENSYPVYNFYYFGFIQYL